MPDDPSISHDVLAQAFAAGPSEPPRESSVKETLISLTISLAVAFTAKAYVLEAFMIPTGSMAPTLLGKHITFQSDQTGVEWDVNPWYYAGDNPFPVQGGRFSIGGSNFDHPPPTVTDPLTTSVLKNAHENRVGAGPGYVVSGNKPLRAGERILVQKYLPFISAPERWEVVVFKNPNERRENYIKRLLGLPMESIWLCDGDVFTLDLERDGSGGTKVRPGARWQVERKPARVQRDLWRPIFSSELAPRSPGAWFTPPWSGDGWDAGAAVTYRHNGPGPSELAWDAESWPLHDRVAYDETISVGGQGGSAFPVSDLRMRAAVQPDGAGLIARATIEARGHEFEAMFDFAARTATVRVRPVQGDGTEGGGGGWTVAADGRIPALDAGDVADIEFWHFDQRVEAWVDGERICSADYDWDAWERLERCTGRTRTTMALPGELQQPRTWAGSAPTVRWRFDGPPLTLHRVGLDRDVYYEPGNQRAFSEASAAKLGPDHFFMCGDNSPASYDGRRWDGVDWWIGDQIDRTPGVVNRRLLMGRAFFVYFPAWHMAFDKVPVPDFGRMRAIR